MSRKESKKKKEKNLIEALSLSQPNTTADALRKYFGLEQRHTYTNTKEEISQ